MVDTAIVPGSLKTDIYDRIGVRTVINGRGATTAVGGTLMRPETLAAMAEATKDPAVIKYFEDNDFGNLGHLGPEKLKAFYISEGEKFKKVVEKAGVALD